jgi:hypothetical protein
MGVRCCLISACALSLLISGPAPAAQDEPPALSSGEMRADVGFLADDLLEGRDAGTRGYDLAALYVAARFEALGLQQALPGSWYQPVTLTIAELDKDAPPSLTIGGRRFNNGDDVVISAFGREPGQSIEAQAVSATASRQCARRLTIMPGWTSRENSRSRFPARQQGCRAK